MRYIRDEVFVEQKVILILLLPRVSYHKLFAVIVKKTYFLAIIGIPQKLSNPK